MVDFRWNVLKAPNREEGFHYFETEIIYLVETQTFLMFTLAGEIIQFD